MGEPKTGKRERNSGIARTDRPCYWVSPPRMKRACAHPNHCCCCCILYILIYNVVVVISQCIPLFPSRNNILSIMLINASKNNTRPEWAYCCPPVCWFVDGSQNVTNIMVSAPAGQKCFIFLMYFNNLHLSPISSILHRSARCMKHMLSRTC